jgi:ribosomal protein S15P/S13E
MLRRLKTAWYLATSSNYIVLTEKISSVDLHLKANPKDQAIRLQYTILVERFIDDLNKILKELEYEKTPRRPRM